MVAGGVSSYGVGKLNFCVGTMNSFAYKQTLLNYEKDIDYYKGLGIELIFQQDNTPCHTSKGSRECLKSINNKLKFSLLIVSIFPLLRLCGVLCNKN